MEDLSKKRQTMEESVPDKKRMKDEFANQSTPKNSAAAEIPLQKVSGNYLIHQEWNEETNNLELNSSFDQQRMENLQDPTKEVSVIDDTTNPAYKALNNSVVLRTIMDKLDARDLLRMRLVSRNWEEEATIQLLSRRRDKRSCRVYFIWDNKKRKFGNKVGTLEEFTDSCCSSPRRKFPCSKFCFEKVTGVNEIKKIPPDLSKFFSNYGHCITSLTLRSFRNSAMALNWIRNIIFEWTPNLRSLSLYINLDKKEPRNGTSDMNTKSKVKPLDNGLQPSKVLLEHLTEFYCNREYLWFDKPFNSTAAERCSLLIQEILSSAQNLQRISDPRLLFTKEIVAAGKIKALHHLEWYEYCPTMLARFLELPSAQPQFTCMEIRPNIFGNSFSQGYTPPPNFFTSLQLILRSSRKSLKTLEIDGQIYLDFKEARINIPVMENLEEFLIYGWNKFQGSRILPPGFSLQKSFPRLKTLMLQGFIEKKSNDTPENPFAEKSNASTSVEKLDIFLHFKFFFHPDWLRQALVLYPNVRILKLNIDDWKELPEICAAIWKSLKESSLEELLINSFSRKYFHVRTNKFIENMDQAMTGFDRKLCGILQKHIDGGSERDLKKEENFERGSSIMDMKRLKLFQLTSEPACGLKLFSRVSVIYAFEPIGKRQRFEVVAKGFDCEW